MTKNDAAAATEEQKEGFSLPFCTDADAVPEFKEHFCSLKQALTEGLPCGSFTLSYDNGYVFVNCSNPSLRDAVEQITADFLTACRTAAAQERLAAALEARVEKIHTDHKNRQEELKLAAARKEGRQELRRPEK